MSRLSTYNTLAARLGISGGAAPAAPRMLNITTNGATYQNNALIGATNLVVTIGGMAQYVTDNYTFDSVTGTVTWVAPYEDGLLGTIQY